MRQSPEPCGEGQAANQGAPDNARGKLHDNEARPVQRHVSGG